MQQVKRFYSTKPWVFRITIKRLKHSILELILTLLTLKFLLQQSKIHIPYPVVKDCALLNRVDQWDNTHIPVDATCE